MKNQKKVRVRFAPSPTGYLHLGNARTALFNWLFARKHGGEFILRIEDTDAERSTRRYEESLLQDLRWLKLEWDEGPDIGGAFGPYRQSSRIKTYQNYARHLLETGQAYHCYCSTKELENQRVKMLEKGEAYRYDNRCRELTAPRRRALEKQGVKPSLRFKIEPGEVVIRDLIRQEVKFDTSLMGDFIIMRPDGKPTFHFAVVLDDSLMEITHVIRGEDHLSNTPRHILLYRALGFVPPQFAHVSLVLSPDRKLLSKRRGEFSIRSLRVKGYLPEAITNYLALLGWSLPGREEIFNLKQLTERFAIEALSSSAAVFDPVKLDWVANAHIRREDPERLSSMILPFLKKAGFLGEVVAEKKYEWVRRIMEAVKDEIANLSQVLDYAPIFFCRKPLPEEAWIRDIFRDPRQRKLLARLEQSLSAAVPPLPPTFWKELVFRLEDDTGLKSKEIYPSLRLVLTGCRHGPELKKILPLIPFDIVLERTRRLLEKMK